ncbi:hypothetical protein RUM44_012722 [Polyplax serrata]|uniref:Thioredoxin domain-containing protein 9 n=1 Tax=Polyplax serrata TaxID=468196 RepID=A0ABR1BC41_POLSC
MSNLESVLKHHVLQATKKVEEHLDAQLEQLDRLDLDDLRSLREKRLQELKKQQKQKQEWLSLGHGEYTEMAEEKEFFDHVKQSTNIVCVFFKSDSPRCAILDHHMKILCVQHLEARFVKINVERAPFLTDRLRICIVPTIALVKDGKVVDYIVGFTELGNCDEFSTEMLEWRIAQRDILEYAGDLSTPPDQQKISRRPMFQEKRKTIRESNFDDTSDDEFLND